MGSPITRFEKKTKFAPECGLFKEDLGLIKVYKGETQGGSIEGGHDSEQLVGP